MAAPRSDMPQLMDALADRVAQGDGVMVAGAAVGMTPGQTANVWSHIKKRLGPQAS